MSTRFVSGIRAAATAALFLISGQSWAQTPLTAYADANGFIDVQKLTCAQLTETFQEDADALTAWYSGWYNGLAKKHFMDLKKGKSSSTRSSCTANKTSTRRSSRRSRSFSKTSVPSSASR